ncbi:MAG: division/cell wall cluster transcriptional repressor MraZ [Nocardioides sp.]
MFFGTFTPKVDDKGRLFLPAKFREQLGAGVVVSPGQERCLNVWRTADFEASTERYKSAPITNAETRFYLRMLAANSSEEVPDRQGRITLSAQLRAWAGVDRDVTVIGSMNHVEIWNNESWARYSAEQEQRFAELSEDIFPPM